MKINLYYWNNGVGVVNDALLLSSLLSTLFCDITRYDLSTTNKLEFFKLPNLKTSNILDDVKIKFSPDSIVLNIACLGKNHEIKVKLAKSLNSPDFKITATFNLGNIFGYK